MNTSFVIKAIPLSIFEKLFSLSDETLSTHHAQWLVVDTSPGYPCRVSLQDAKVGERVLALSFTHHDVDSPYRSSGPIFIREAAQEVNLAANEVPKMLRHRLLSIRAYDVNHMMIDASLCEGDPLESDIAVHFQNSRIEYLHIHNANPGCFNCFVFKK